MFAEEKRKYQNNTGDSDMTKDRDCGHFPGRLSETKLDGTACLLTQVRQELWPNKEKGY
jgi:hypothetical protein